MNRAELARDTVFWNAVADQARARAAAARNALEDEARREHAEQGIAPTWRIPGLGTVPLSLTSDAVDIADEQAYTAWVAKHYPDEIETVQRVRPAFDDRLRKGAARRGDPPCDRDGTVIDGLRFRPGGQPRGVSVRPDDAAKAAAAQAAEAFLTAQAQAAAGGAA